MLFLHLQALQQEQQQPAEAAMSAMTPADALVHPGGAAGHGPASSQDQTKSRWVLMAYRGRLVKGSAVQCRG